MVAASTCHWFAAFAVSDDSSSCSERRGVGLVLEFRLVFGVSILLSGSTRGIRPSQFRIMVFLTCLAGCIPSF